MTGVDETHGEQWQHGPLDLPEPDALGRVLERVNQGGQMVDFLVSEDLFYQLLRPDEKDGDWFVFSAGSIRWKDQSGATHDDRKRRTAINQAATIEFPAPLSACARWYQWACAFTGCEWPEYLNGVLLATDFQAADSILRAVHMEAEVRLSEADATFQRTPERPVAAHYEAKSARDDARRKVDAVAGCQVALRATEVSGAAVRPQMSSKLSRVDIARKGGKASNAKNREAKAAIIAEYRTGEIEKKDAAALDLAKKHNKSVRTVRDMLKGVEYEGVSRDA